MRVPDCLRPALGLRELRRSLGTADPRAARIEAMRLAAVTLQAWEDMRGMLDIDHLTGDEIAALTPEQIDALPPGALTRIVARFKMLCADMKLELVREEQALQRKALELQDFRQVVRELKDETFKGEQQAVQFQVQKLMLETQLALLERSGQSAKLSLFDGLKDGAKAPWHSHLVAFMDSIKVSVSTSDSYRKAFERLAETVGGEPLAVLCEGLNQMRDAVAAFKANDKGAYTRLKEQATGTLSMVTGGKAIALLDADGILDYRGWVIANAKPKRGKEAAAEATVQKMLSHVKTFGDWAASPERKLAKTNPAAGIGVPSGLSPAEIRRPFTREELEVIFRSPLFTGCASVARRSEAGPELIRDAKFYLPLAGLLTGARLDELASARASMVAVVEGHVCLRILAGKTVNATRLIPVHPVLRRVGFLQWVEQRRAAAGVDALIFPDSETDGGLEDYGKWWANVLDDWIGIDDPTRTFHSFRHTFKKAIRGRVGSDETSNRLMGHKPKNVAEAYGIDLDQHEMELFCAIPAIGTDLPHLYVAD